MAGTRQLVEVIFDSHARPIPSALESNRLVPAKQTCEECHWRELSGSVRVRLISKFAEDEANTPSQTVLTMLVGGVDQGGIHGSHMGPGIEIRYRVADEKRQDIPWVEYKNSQNGESRTYLASKAKAEQVSGLPMHTMQCVDCHNRATHAFDLPDRAVDKALAGGRMSSSLPYLKKKSVEVLKASYSSSDEAARKIPEAIAEYYKQEYPALYRERDAQARAAQLGFALEKSTLEKEALDTRLKLLQAQIEPLFLFNTVANVQALVESGSPQVAPVLKSLIAYLRAAMPRLHAGASTLANEIALARSYLELMQMRMRDRAAQGSQAAARGLTAGVARRRVPDPGFATHHPR
jgi:hypothetical protein